MHPDGPAWYVHRNLDAPVHESILALDTFARLASLRPVSPYARLLARPAPDTGTVPPGLPSRTFTGRVRLGGPGPAVRTELDVTAWSSTRSGIGVRPAGRRPPSRRRTRYFAAAHALLGDLGPKLDLLVRLDGGPRSDTARHVARLLVVSPEPPAVERLATALR